MKKYFVNEDWEFETFEDDSNLFLLVVEQNIPACSYVHKYGINPDLLKPDYTQIVDQYKDTEVDGLLKIQLVKVPNTPQIQTQICCADSEHKGNTEDAIDAINAVLNRADCEILESWSKSPLTEKKHKKRRLTHTTKLNKYRTFLTDDAVINFKTDNDELFEESLEYFNECDFDITYITRDLHNSEKNEGNIRTEHENMFSQQGIKIKHLTAVKK